MMKQPKSMSNLTTLRNLLRKLQDGVQLYSTKEIIKSSKEYYEQHLKQCRYNEKFNYLEENKKTNPKSRQRTIIWFNPAHSKSIKTNVNKFFLWLINKHFQKFNRNAIKNSSYSCMLNIKSKVFTLNRKILQTQQTKAPENGILSTKPTVS